MKGKLVDTWYFNPDKSKSSRKGIYSPHKIFLYEVLLRSLTQHNLEECRWLLQLLPRMTNIDPYVIFRFVMIMIYSVDDESVSRNFMTYLETLLSKLELTKPDVFLEFLTYFISKNRIEDARELYDQRHRFMSYQYHRQVPLINVNVGCYDLLFNYLGWKDKASDNSTVPFDVSIQGWLVNAMTHLKNTNSNHELFVMCVAEVLLFYGFKRKTYLFLSEFQRSNQDNLTAQLLLYKLIQSLSKGTPRRRRRESSLFLVLDSSEEERSKDTIRQQELASLNNFSNDICNTDPDIEDFPILSDRKNIFDNLIRLDPNCDEILELSATYCERLQSIRLLMDSLENTSEIRIAERWQYLEGLLEKILSSDDEAFIEEVRTLWQTRYYPYWKLKDILALAVDSSSPGSKVRHRKLIKRVFRTLTDNFNPDEQMSITPEVEEGFPLEEYYDIDGV